VPVLSLAMVSIAIYVSSVCPSVCQLPAAKDEQLVINSGSEGSALHYISLLYYEIITSTAWLVGETEKKNAWWLMLLR
jgi:hypothetical protein